MSILEKIKLNNRYIRFIAKKIVCLLFPIKNKRILLIQESFSGSNTYALNKFFSKKFKKENEIILYKDGSDNIKKFILISSSRIVISTHATYKFKTNQISIQLWHGPLVKKNGAMMINNNFKFSDGWNKINFIMSYSETYSTFMNACMLANYNKYIITGAPRNDFLFNASSRRLINKKQIKKVLIALTMNEDINLYKLFLNKKIDNYLRINNFIFYLKIHPHDEKLINEKKLTMFTNINLISDQWLSKEKIDFYEILNQFDILITDFSSIFFDYLLLDRPIIFLNNLINKRGFLVESLKEFLPGPFFSDELQLIKILSQISKVSSKYKNQRIFVKNQFHRFQDGNSSHRIEKFIKKVI